MYEIIYCRYQNNDQSVRLILKWDPGITDFSIPDAGIENSVLGLQSTVTPECGIKHCV